ncbi:hypothetical protein HMI56_003962 [Coelomomyces lativittatus]|nr:hypothetical protein HMI56_003962 [Coelomomyces lativittatus]
MKWFLMLLRDQLMKQPFFVILDRDNGLINAVDMVFTSVHLVYCFWHVIKNFNQKFKNKKWKEKAWWLAKALNTDSFQSAESFIEKENAAVIGWLQQIKHEKISLIDSPVGKYGIVMSNSVESINSRISPL